MNRFLILCAVSLLLGACSTKTLLNVNVDADSFVPAETRSGSFPVTVLGDFEYRFPDDDGDTTNGNDPNGSSLSVPSLKFVTAATLTVKLTVNTSLTANLELYIAPDGTADIYLPQYQVLQGSTATGATFEASANLSATSSDAAQKQAFEAIQSGKFRIGARARGTGTAGALVGYTIDDLFVSVSGYPIQVFF
ncbi:MAG: hypothetical protein HC933_20080 [Pleurocapsa sp. SU_196_0]|nr:hypothetical protein [Pleurocapsa sp. SU_196_0]